jgi:hypothetical protein
MMRMRRYLAIAVAAFLLTGQARATAQPVSAPDLRAAFLFNFVKFTAWPSDALPGSAPLVVCIAGDDRVAEAFETLTKDQTVDGRKFVVRRAKKDDSLSGCHLVYASDLDLRRARDLVNDASGAAVLTVSDYTDFVHLGGIASLFVENGRTRFAVNPDAAERAHLRISSKLLGLAKIVRDESNGSR